MLSRAIVSVGLTAVAVLALIPGRAAAHPHEWVDIASEIFFDGEGRLTAVRHHWRFDEAFSAYAEQGLDTNGDGKLSAEELAPLAQINVDSLAEFDFFTDLVVGDDLVKFGKPEDYWLDKAGDRLILHYTLPLAEPLPAGTNATLEVYDPEYYIAFSLPNRQAVRLIDAPPACTLTVNPAMEPDATTAALLATVGADQRELPADMQGLTGGLENSASVDCGAGPAAAGNAAAALGAKGGAGSADLRALPPPTADELAADRIAAKKAAARIAVAQAAAPKASEPAAGVSPGPAARDSAPATKDAAAEAAAAAEPAIAPAALPRPGLMARVTVLQSRFYRSLTAALKTLKTDGGAFWWLGGVSFLYGIFHAAGPGHGKVVVSGYLLANEVQLRRGVGIAFLSALAQAVTAIVIVGIMAIVLGATSTAMTRTAGFMESASYALVLTLGVYLVIRKGRDVARLVAGGAPAACGHAHHHHGLAGHDGHSHGRLYLDPAIYEEPSKEHAAPRAARGSALATIVSVGFRPCSGALIVLVFALAQGVFWAGIAATLLMAFGTAITVAALATLAVLAKGVAARLADRKGGRTGEIVLFACELAAAVLIAALGGVLLVGSLLA